MLPVQPTSISLLAVALVLAGCYMPPPPSETNATLRVNDTRAGGAVGDDLLSLREALRIAAGSLALDALSPAELAQVEGTPGAASPDLIELVVGSGVAIEAEAAVLPGASILPFLVNNDGDVIDGLGAVLTIPDGAPTGDRTGIMVMCDDVTIRNLEFRDLQFGIIVIPSGPDWRVSGVTIVENAFRNVSGIGVVASAWGIGNEPGGEMRALRILHNRFYQPDVAINAIAVSAAGTNLPNQSSSGALLEDVVIAGNRILGGNVGINIAGASTTHGSEIQSALTRNVRVEANVIAGIWDVSINVVGGSAYQGGTVRDSGVEEIDIVRNIVTDTQGTPMWIGGGALFQQPGGTARGNFVRDLAIRHNATIGGEDCNGISLNGGWAEWSEAGISAENAISDVTIEDNRTRGPCSNGVSLHGGATFASAGEVFDNRIEDVRIARNRMRDHQVGINILAGFAIELAENTGGYWIPDSYDTIDLPSYVDRNRITRVEISQNEIRDTGFALIVAGGLVFDAPDRVTNNVSDEISARENVYIDNESQYDCSFYDELVLGEAPGEVSGNSVSILCDWAF